MIRYSNKDIMFLCICIQDFGVVKERVELSIVFVLATINNIGKLGNNLILSTIESSSSIYADVWKLQECQISQDLEGSF
jgi:hypothetical protein